MFSLQQFAKCQLKIDLPRLKFTFPVDQLWFFWIDLSSQGVGQSFHRFAQAASNPKNIPKVLIRVNWSTQFAFLSHQS